MVRYIDRAADDAVAWPFQHSHHGLFKPPFNLREHTVKATAELQVVPIGDGVSVRQEIIRVTELLKGHDFLIETHASGTNIEGELHDILAVVEQIHADLHRSGTVRLLSYLKLETRTDKSPTLAGKRL